MSALVEKKTGFDGSLTLIQGGFRVWCNAGSIFAQDISRKSYNVKRVTKVKTFRNGNCRGRRWRPMGNEPLPLQLGSAGKRG